MKTAWPLVFHSIAVVAVVGQVQAQTPTATPRETILHNFRWTWGSDSNTGSVPWGRLMMDGSGALYGSAQGSFSDSDYGAIFKLSPPASGKTKWAETTLFRFPYVTDPSTGAGSYPYGYAPNGGLLFGKDRAIYGTTQVDGVLFKLSRPAAGASQWKAAALHRFVGDAAGFAPNGDLVMDSAGALYGTTGYGGSKTCKIRIWARAPRGCGTVFKLSPPGPGRTKWIFSVLHAFKSGKDGAVPYAGLILGKGGALYGSTYLGGMTEDGSYMDGAGTVFKLTPPAPGKTSWTISNLYVFKGWTDGVGPQTLVSDAAGALYGGTANGGPGNFGVIFKLAPPPAGKTQWTKTTLYSFPRTADNLSPMGMSPNGLMLRNGVLFGTTSAGGGSNPNNIGTAFKLSPPTAGSSLWTASLLRAFRAPDGAGPTGGFVSDRAGVLYGSTSSGGAYGVGTVYKLTGATP